MSFWILDYWVYITSVDISLTVLIIRSALVQYMKSNEEREQEKMEKWGGNRPAVVAPKKDGKINVFVVKNKKGILEYANLSPCVICKDYV